MNRELMSMDTSAKLLMGITRGLKDSAIKSGSKKRACTAIVLRHGSSGELEALFILRASNRTDRVDRWSGHVAVPGGHQDATDSSDMHTAIREVQEEVGLDLSPPRFECLGRLDDRNVSKRGRPINGFLLSPFVFEQKQGGTPDLTLQEAELAGARWVKLSALHHTKLRRFELSCPVQEMLPFTTYFPNLLLRLVGLTPIYWPMYPLTPAGPSADVISKSSNLPPNAQWDYRLWGLTLRAVQDMLLQAIPYMDPKDAQEANPLVSGVDKQGTVIVEVPTWPMYDICNPAVQVLSRAWCGYKELSQCWGAKPLFNLPSVHIHQPSEKPTQMRMAIHPANVVSLVAVVGGCMLLGALMRKGN
eukprot:TRINITY_DN48367_c0_g1_i1.p1 TRINITY_DN48367_c0_g1~~TRINITY_DN48367_c0_g1_i1.p1  ORF type:complete len:360 (-),score=14.17 TRINITY_DN48367_c0_g1_i1:68-1147(-)